MEFEITIVEPPSAELLKVGTIRTENTMTSFTVTTNSPSASNVTVSERRETRADLGNANQGDATASTEANQPDSSAKMRPKTQSAIPNSSSSQTTTPPIPHTVTTTRKRRAPSSTFNHTPSHTLRHKKSYESKDADPKLDLFMLSFPMKLHLILERTELERNKRKVQSTPEHKRQKKGEGNDCENKKQGNEEKKAKEKDDVVIGWMPSGKAFKIYDEERFVREIMPTFFLDLDSNNSCKINDNSESEEEQRCSFENFQRNLDIWGFTDMPCVEGPTTRKIHVCSHPNFVRDQPDACRKMKFLRERFPSSFAYYTSQTHGRESQRSRASEP